MDNSYSHEKKKRLAEKISKLKKKEDMVKIMEIIYENNKNITENQNGVFMLFHKLDDATYHKIDLYLRSIVKKRSPDDNTTTSDTKSDKKEFTSYSKNDFPDQEKLNPKLKYSNRERNMIKRQRYDNHIANENNLNDNVVYQKFDVNILSDSDTTTPIASTSATISTPTQSTNHNTNTSESIQENLVKKNLKPRKQVAKSIKNKNT
ncbi:bromodomain extra-terminal - transcription regulation [Fadolivirus algeromassiliense]|jgi:hypothetical protein|uniref:Bromodomain extra-terminal - transcription regulation n=1 Tax=Fadolivirus FV1/VV64 TaxID=3070911 RepID=A0A7D3R0J5_9VIRU|nr:bromodomain extra-terminal - transcription regulation [Fadolivirus algeromassiliense]QKF93762.1 bromodomain extra-terminal - transcription regulation [Fadolivirus FV1/VV64]